MSNPYNTPFGNKGVPSNPYSAPTYQPYGAQPSVYYRPHRGGLVLTLGIVGLVMTTVGSAIAAAVCIPVPCLALAVSIPAWICGHKDMQAFARGEIDPTGKGMTMAGMIMGIVATVIGGLFTVIVLVVALGFIAIMIMAIAAGSMR